MIGAIIGDIVGSRFESFDEVKKDFTLFTEHNNFTDDTVLTCAIAKAILNCGGDYSCLGKEAVASMQELGKKYRDCGYGSLFYNWLKQSFPKPYNSFGNGSAMRVSPVAFVAKNLEEVKELSKKVTEITHNHPEGIKGAEGTAVAIWMARNGSTKEEIKDYIETNYYAVPNDVCDFKSSRETTCPATMPQVFYAFFASNSFEDAIRIAISLGGDTDTLGAITGSIAEAFYGIPKKIKDRVRKYLSEELFQIVKKFYKKFGLNSKRK